MNRRDLIILGGTAIAWPLAARAQQTAMPVIDYLSGYSPGQSASYLTAFLQGLSESGFVQSQSVGVVEAMATASTGVFRPGAPDARLKRVVNGKITS